MNIIDTKYTSNAGMEKLMRKSRHRFYGIYKKLGISFLILLLSVAAGCSDGEENDTSSPSGDTEQQVSEAADTGREEGLSDPVTNDTLFLETFEGEDSSSKGSPTVTQALYSGLNRESDLVAGTNMDGSTGTKWYRNLINGSVYFGESFWEDYSVQTEIRFGENCNPDASNIFRLFSRAKQSTLYGDFYYAASLEGGDKVSLVKAYATGAGQAYGTKTLETVTVEPYLTDQQTHTLRIDTSDQTITIYWDNEEVITYTDTEGVQNEKGGSGIYTENTSVYLDNIRITQLAGTEETEEVIEEPPIVIEEEEESSDWLTSDGKEQGLYYVGNTWHLPGDTAYVKGAGLDEIVSVGISRLEDEPGEEPAYVLHPEAGAMHTMQTAGEASEASYTSEYAVTAEILQSREDSFKFVLPGDLEEGIYAVRITLSSGDTLDYYLNAPVVEWAQGDEGKTATPGGTLRLFGSNLLPDGAPSEPMVILRAEDGTLTRLTGLTGNLYSAGVRIPEDMKYGDYDVFLYNGYGDHTAFCEPVSIRIGASPRESWPDDVFNVCDFGAVGDGKANDTDAVLDAVNAAKKNGGGVVYFPAGRYFLDEGFTIPKRTVIRGDSAVETQIFFTPFNWDYGRLPSAILKGSTHFAVEDITFAGSRIGTFIKAGVEDKKQAADDFESLIKGPGAVTEEDVKAENIYIKNCRFYFNSLGGTVTLSWNSELYAKMVDEVCNEYSSDILRIGGENIQITGNEFICSGRPIAEGKKTYSVISGNTIQTNLCNWAPLGNFSCGIVEDNHFNNCMVGLSGQNIYIAENTIENCMNNNREVFTTDGGAGGYNGTIVKSGSCTYTLPGADYEEDERKGTYALFLLDGKGAGQFRRIVSNTKDAITLESEFYVEPDENTFAAVVELRDTMYFVDNYVYNGGDFQFYGMQTNSVVDGLELERCGGLGSYGRYVYGAYQPNWYNSLINNKIHDGNFFWYYGYDAHSGLSYIEVRGVGRENGMNMGTLVRRNDLSENTCIKLDSGSDESSLMDLIVDDNTITGSERGIVFQTTQTSMEGVLISRTQFNDVKQEWYWRDGEAADLIHNAGENRLLILDIE